MLGTGQAKLTLGELRGATCLVQTSLLALHDASVAGQEASLLQAGAVNEDDSVELAFELEQNDRGVDLTLQQLGGEVLLQSAAVDGPLAVTRNQTDTGDSLLAATGAVARLNRGGAGASASVGLGGVVGELLFGLDNLGVVGVFSHDSYLLSGFTWPAARPGRSRRPGASAGCAGARRHGRYAGGRAAPWPDDSSAACP